MNFPDGKIRENKKELYGKCFPAAKKFAPDIILSFGADGISGHLDHIAIGAVAKKLAQKLRARFIVFAAPPRLIKNFHHLKKRRKFGVYAERVVHAPHNMKIDINGTVKLRALLCLQIPV